MLSTKTQEIIDKIIAERINTLLEILHEGEEGPAQIAAVRLAQIGTRESSDALMLLIEQGEDSGLRDVMVDALIAFSPLRADYKERLVEACEAEGIDILFASAEQQEHLRDMQPLCTLIAEALEAEYVITGDRDEIEEACEGIPFQLR